MTRIRSIQEHLNRWILVYVSLAIVVGLTAGHLLAATTKAMAAETWEHDCGFARG